MKTPVKALLIGLLCVVLLFSLFFMFRKNNGDPAPSGTIGTGGTTTDTIPGTVYYTVAFDCVGGSPIAAQSVEHEHLAVRPEDPVKEGFSFIEWQYQNAAYDFNTPVTQNITLTAVYQKNEGVETVTVTLDCQNGTPAAQFEIQKGTVLPVPLQPKKAGYDFSGWFLGAVKFDFATPIQQDITLTANWIPSSTDPITESTGESTDAPADESTAGTTVSTTPPPSRVSEVNLATDKLSLEPGDTKTLHAIITPENAEDQTVKWASSDPTVASVSEDGKVTAHKVGAATIIVTTNDGGYSAACLVVVTTDPLTASAKHQLIISTGADGSIRQGFDLDITANGGTESYTYNVKIFRNGVLEATKKDAFIKYYITSGSYRVEITVTDSGGNKVILDPIQIS